MWQELKQKLPKKITWDSDGETGTGELIDMKITEERVEFIIQDPVHGRFSLLSSGREYVGIVPSSDMENLHICAPFMGEIVMLSEKKKGDSNVNENGSPEGQ